jgi:hypothetical protein
VKCTSTRVEQVELFRAIFERYGHVYTDEATLARRARQSIGMEVRLNRTFAFLVPKADALPDWVAETDQTFFAFLAGYIDAEGYIRTYLPRGYRTRQVQLEVRSYDMHLLTALAAGLNARGISCRAATLTVRSGYVNGYGVRSNCDLWRFGVSSKSSLDRLFAMLDPHLRHGRRRSDMLAPGRLSTLID